MGQVPWAKKLSQSSYWLVPHLCCLWNWHRPIRYATLWGYHTSDGLIFLSRCFPFLYILDKTHMHWQDLYAYTLYDVSSMTLTTSYLYIPVRPQSCPQTLAYGKCGFQYMLLIYTYGELGTGGAWRMEVTTLNESCLKFIYLLILYTNFLSILAYY